MKNFINLTSRVINKLHIIEITKQSTSYSIHMSTNSINGVILFSSGVVTTQKNIIEISEKYDKEDYDTITKIIKEIC